MYCFYRCNVGDIVLLCLDERHEQYVVFSVGNTLHFLHTECLQALNLKTGKKTICNLNLSGKQAFQHLGKILKNKSELAYRAGK